MYTISSRAFPGLYYLKSRLSLKRLCTENLCNFYPQKLQEEVGDISLVASVLAIDLSDPDLDGKTRDKVKDVSSRWAKAWNWSEDRGQKLTKAMIDWQKFRDEELTLLNWLSQKEKTLKQVASTDVADEEQVKESLELLEVMLSLE